MSKGKGQQAMEHNWSPLEFQLPDGKDALQTKLTKLIDIITPALVVFERVISGALKNGVIDEEEFNTLQTLHLETLKELTGVDRRMEAENRSLVEKSLMEEINNMKKKNQGTSV